MILCPRCLKKINRDRHDVAEGMKCPSCRQEFNNLNAIPCLSFPDCIIKLRYVGLNSPQDANTLLRLMEGSL